MALCGTRTTLSKAEYEALVLNQARKGGSMFESCLRHPLGEPFKVKSGPSAAEKVEASLVTDRDNFQRKYGALSGGVGRYVVNLPVGPQHSKFSHHYRAVTSGDEHSGAVKLHQEGQRSPDPHSGRPKFNIPTLRKWFGEIDVNQTGSITRRELIVALRQHTDLQALLLSNSDQKILEGPGTSSTSSTTSTSIKQQNLEMKRIMSIMHEVDTDGSGSMEWEEFVEFFRRSGFLLEYNTRKMLNDTSFRTSADRVKDAHLNNEREGVMTPTRMERMRNMPPGLSNAVVSEAGRSVSNHFLADDGGLFTAPSDTALGLLALDQLKLADAEVDSAIRRQASKEAANKRKASKDRELEDREDREQGTTDSKSTSRGGSS